MISKWIQSILNKKKPGREQWLILLLAGILILVVAWPVNSRDKKSNGSGKNEPEVDGYEKDYITELESRLASILSELEGAGKVSVMITLKSTSEKVVEKDVERENDSTEEEDSEGGKRVTKSERYSEECKTYALNEGEEPYVRKEICPEIEGVVVLAEGGSDAVVKKNITEAVLALFNIESHKIRIMKGRWMTE